MPHPELTLERRIDAELCGLDAKMCVYADDLHGHVVERGADDEFESASTIKIYILGCLYAQTEAGKASLDAELTYEARHFVDGSGLIRSLGEGARLRAHDVATLMIVVSDNIATNMLIDYLGLDTINAFIRSIGCTHTKLHRSLRSDNWSEKLVPLPRGIWAAFLPCWQRASWSAPRPAMPCAMCSASSTTTPCWRAASPRITPTPKNPTRIRV